MQSFVSDRHYVPDLARRVLIVEDDAFTLHALSRALTLNGYSTICAVSLAQAKAAMIRQPHFVLSDLELPDGSGLDLLVHLKRRNDSAAVAVVTGACDRLVRAAAALKPDAIFRKPVNLPAILGWLSAPVAAGLERP